MARSIKIYGLPDDYPVDTAADTLTIHLQKQAEFGNNEVLYVRPMLVPGENERTFIATFSCELEDFAEELEQSLKLGPHQEVTIRIMPCPEEHIEMNLMSETERQGTPDDDEEIQQIYNPPTDQGQEGSFMAYSSSSGNQTPQEGSTKYNLDFVDQQNTCISLPGDPNQQMTGSDTPKNQPPSHISQTGDTDRLHTGQTHIDQDEQNTYQMQQTQPDANVSSFAELEGEQIEIPQQPQWQQQKQHHQEKQPQSHSTTWPNASQMQHEQQHGMSFPHGQSHPPSQFFPPGHDQYPPGQAFPTSQPYQTQQTQLPGQSLQHNQSYQSDHQKYAPGHPNPTDQHLEPSHPPDQQTPIGHQPHQPSEGNAIDKQTQLPGQTQVPNLPYPQGNQPYPISGIPPPGHQMYPYGVYPGYPPRPPYPPHGQVNYPGNDGQRHGDGAQGGRKQYQFHTQVGYDVTQPNSWQQQFNPSGFRPQNPYGGQPGWPHQMQHGRAYGYMHSQSERYHQYHPHQPWQQMMRPPHQFANYPNVETSGFQSMPPDNRVSYPEPKCELDGTQQNPEAVPTKNINIEREKQNKKDINKDTSSSKDVSNVRSKEEEKTTLGMKEDETTSQEQEAEEEEGTEEDPIRIVEVTGFKPTTDTDTLELYFENKRSGGGAILEHYLKDDKTLVIKFEDPKVIDQVLGKQKHTVDGATLQVKEAIIPPRDKTSFIMEGLPEETTREELELYLENRTGMSEPELFFGERQGTVLIRYSEEIKDFNKVVTRIAERKFKSTVLKVKQTEVTNCVLVTNLPGDVAEDFLELYFENTTKSGGGPINEIVIEKDRKLARVYFKDYKVVDAVLKKPHKIKNISLEVQPFNDCIGYVVSREEPLPSMPEPITINMDPKILQFIKTKKETFQQLKQSLSAVYGEIDFQKEGIGAQILVKPTLTNTTPGVYKIIKTWSTEVRETIDKFLKLYKIVSIQVNEGIWLQAKTQIGELSEGEVRPTFDDEMFSVLFTGKVADAENLEIRVNNEIRSIEEELEKQRQRVAETLKFTPLKIRQLQLYKFSQTTMQKYPELAVNVDPKNNSITLEGSKTYVTEAKLSIYEILNKVVTGKGKPPSRSLGDFLKTERVLLKVQQLIQQSGIEAIFSVVVDDDELICSAVEEEGLKQALDVLHNSAVEGSINIQPQSKTALQQEEWNTLVNKLRNENIARIDVTEDDMPKVKVITFQDSLQSIMADLESFLKLHTVIEDSVQIESGKLKFISTYKQDNLQKLQKGKLQPVKVTIRTKGSLGSILMTGTQDDVMMNGPKLRDLVNGILFRQYTMDKPGMPKLFSQERGKSYLTTIENTCLCIIEVNDPTEDTSTEAKEITLPALQDGDDIGISDQADVHNQGDAYVQAGASFDGDGDYPFGQSMEHTYMQTTAKRRHRRSRRSQHSSAQSQYRTAEGILLKLVKGNIVNQSADVIVNTIASSCDLTVGVISHAMLLEGGEELQEEISQSKMSQNVNEGDLIPTTGGDLNCKYVYHVCILGTNWNGGKAEPLLRRVLGQALNLAQRNRMTSIVIPAIGTGGMKYPKDVTAKIMYEEVIHFSRANPRTTVSKVTVVVYDKDHATCKAFESEISKLPQISSTLGEQQEAAMAAAVVISGTAFKTAEGKVVHLVKGDIAAQKADIIVNTISTSCDLNTGVVSTTIRNAAGQLLQEDIDIKKPASVNEGDIIETFGGNLSCKYVYHVCILGTSWDGGAKVEPFVRGIIKRCLQSAHKSNMASIAIPALGTGGLNYPRDVVAKIIYEEAISFSKSYPASSLNEIRVVVYDKDQVTIKAFEDKMDELKGNKVTTSGLSTIKKSSLSGNVYTNTEGKTIKLVKGNIANEQADVIVNSIQTSCNLSGGVISQAILNTGGPTLQTEINQKKPPNVNMGDVIVTGGGQLKCKNAYHACIIGNHWDGGAKCDPLLRGIVTKCLDTADQANHSSIAIPAMGTGGLQYPSDIVAKIIYEETNKFSAKKPNSTLTDIRVVVYDQNQPACKAFEDELQKLPVSPPTATLPKVAFLPQPVPVTLPVPASTATPTPQPVGSLPTVMSKSMRKRHVGILFFVGQRPSSIVGPMRAEFIKKGINENRSLYTDLQEDKGQMMIGSICLQVHHGDITAETTDAIVNSSNPDLDLKRGGGVQTAIVKQAGDDLVKECQQLVKRDGKVHSGSVVMTGAGKLKCGKIIHVVMDPENMDTTLFEMLEIAEKNQMTSIALPLLGTGEHKMKPKDASGKILETIGKFILKCDPKSLRLIRVTIFKVDTVSEFQKTMKDYLGKTITESKGWLRDLFGSACSKLFGGSKKTKKSDMESFNTLVFNIYAENQTNLDNAVKKIENHVKEDTSQMEVTKANVEKLTSEDIREIERFAETLGVQVKQTTVGNTTSLKIQGLIQDVVQVNQRINGMIDKITATIHEESSCRIVAKNVKWKFDDNGQFEEYDELITGKIEMAFNKNQQGSVDVEINDGKYRIDFKSMTEIDLQDISSTVNVRRELKEGGITLPTKWQTMTGSDQFIRVKLNPNSSEYKDVDTRIRQSHQPSSIIQIDRIQNPKLYRQYEVEKQTMDAKNKPKTDNEKLLFHGTTGDSIKKINTSGFNRSFAGKNAAAYGNGTYFAVNASYSAGGYARPDASGHKHMYLARVLTGIHTQGKGGMLVPPSKNPNDPTDCYDSVVDNPTTPTMYIVFNDAMAYPEYLIIFK